jgi:hypothetical protein
MSVLQETVCSLQSKPSLVSPPFAIVRSGREAARVGLAGSASRDGPTAARPRPQMAPQAIEKTKSAPGNGIGRPASIPEIGRSVPDRLGDRAALLTGGISVAGTASRDGLTATAAPGNGAASD